MPWVIFVLFSVKSIVLCLFYSGQNVLVYSCSGQHKRNDHSKMHWFFFVLLSAKMCWFIFVLVGTKEILNVKCFFFFCSDQNKKYHLFVLYRTI